MTNVSRSCTCPTCGLEFFIHFDSASPLSDVAIPVLCPRSVDGASFDPLRGKDRCKGFVLTHLPDRYSLAANRKQQV